MAHLLESLIKSSTERASRLDAARKRYVELLKAYVYEPASINAKSQAEFKDVAESLGIELGQIQIDLDKLKEVKRLEEILSRGHGAQGRIEAAKKKAELYRAESARIICEREAGYNELVLACRQHGEDAANAMRARDELKTLKQTLGDLAGHVDLTLND